MAGKPSAVMIRGRRPRWLRFLALMAVVLALAGVGVTPGAWGQLYGRETTPNDPELLFWQSIMNSKSAGDYQAYLSTYPSGKFAALVKARLSTLGGTQPTAGGQASPQPGGADATTALRQGAEAIKGGDYAEAMKAWGTAAQAGSPPAMVLIGDLYYYGRSVPQDYGAALQWFHQAADKGNPEGEYHDW
jgi:TPR repeat protein